jgi:uncharacterized cupin superfamily protein
MQHCPTFTKPIMKKINTRNIKEESGTSPKGIFGASTIGLSLALGREPMSTDLDKRHPFDVEISRIPPGKKLCPYHSHSAQWEFYHVISGQGTVRHEGGMTEVDAGDAFIFKPGEPHQMMNNGTEDFVFYVIADNPLGDSCHYPDSGKWLVRSPERKLIRSEGLDYFDGEE